jgi:hypothetical protein
LWLRVGCHAQYAELEAKCTSIQAELDRLKSHYNFLVQQRQQVKAAIDAKYSSPPRPDRHWQPEPQQPQHQPQQQHQPQHQQHQQQQQPQPHEQQSPLLPPPPSEQQQSYADQPASSEQHGHQQQHQSLSQLHRAVNASAGAAASRAQQQQQQQQQQQPASQLPAVNAATAACPLQYGEHRRLQRC